MPPIKRVLVTGGAGYIGSNLVPKLLSSKYEVNVLDLFMYGSALQVFDDAACLGLRILKGDIRDLGAVRRALRGCHAVIHLACISNDPCFELDPAWCRSIDVDALQPLIKMAKDVGVQRFIYASSSSVYGSRGEEAVTEDLELKPLTGYSESKVRCEDILREEAEPGFVTTILRPATVCGYSPRLRLDVVVNALTLSALASDAITVDGGEQARANLHIEDMTDLYRYLLRLPPEMVDGKTWNVGAANMTVREIAKMVKRRVDGGWWRRFLNFMSGRPGVGVVTKPVVDQRSYRVSSDKIARDIGFVPQRSVSDAIDDLRVAFAAGKIPNAMTDDRYYNIRCLKKHLAEAA